MSKSKSAETPHYELLYIISNKYSEDELPAINENVKKFIIQQGGSLTKEDNWGKKRLAYPIKHFRHGYYQLIEFDLPNSQVNINVIDNNLRLSDQILRHQIIKKNKNAIQPKIIIKNKEEEPTIKKSKKETKKIEPKPNLEKSPIPLNQLQDLDEKLDKILDSNTFL